jgi:hypothetical protein
MAAPTPETKQFEDYFKDDLDAINSTISDIELYKKGIDGRIGLMQGAGSRGGEHYLTDHYKNAIALETMKATLLEDRFEIHKTVMDYAVKATVTGGGDNESALISIARNLYKAQVADLNSANAVMNSIGPNGIVPQAANGETADAAIDKRLDKK